MYRFLKLDSICASVKSGKERISLLNRILTENGKGKQVSDGGGEAAAAAAALPCRSVKLMRLDLMTSSLHFIDYRFKRRGAQR